MAKRDHSSLSLKIGSILAGLVFWHFLATVVVNDTTLLVSPLVVLRTAYQMLFVTGELYPHLFASSWIFINGFILAIVVGVPLGFAMALNVVVRDYVMSSDRTAPPEGAMFAVNMLAGTRGGGTYTFEEIVAGLSAAGFHRIRPVRTQGMFSLVEGFSKD